MREAILRKEVSNAEVARAFGVKGPSVYDWLKHGRIGKQHINQLVAYFADVVPPSHWGIEDAPQPGLAKRQIVSVPPVAPAIPADDRAILDLYHGMTPAQRATWATVGRALAQPALKRGKTRRG